MNKQFLLPVLIFLFSSLLTSAQSLTGNVTDSANHQVIQGAAVYFPELKMGAFTDAEGNYKISPLPKGVYEVELQMLGYATLTKQVTVNGDATLNFAMVVSTATSNEVVITALGNTTSAQRSPVPVTLVTHDAMLQAPSTNVIDAIANQPGLNEVTEGPGISKPEINGLGYNRVLTLFDGERQEDFQWGDEHGILIDPYAVYDAEIIRGPASLQYGANAVAGVVSFKTQPFAENGTIQGSVLTEYQTNNGQIGTSADVGGNHNGFVWDLRGSNVDAHCYTNPKDGYVWGTAFVQQYIRGVLGWNKKWGYSRISISALHRRVEVPDGNRDSTGRFEFDYPQNGQVYPTRANFLSYSPDIAGDQNLGHYELWWQNSFNTGKGRFEADMGYTESIRREITQADAAGVGVVIHDIPYSLKYQLASSGLGLKLTAGLNGRFEFAGNLPEPPAPYTWYPYLPDYNVFDIGAYAVVQKDFKNLTLSGGFRYDLRQLNSPAMYVADFNTPSETQVAAGTPGATIVFPQFNHTYTGPSASAGASYQLPANNYIKLNLALSYRAPEVNELTSNALNFGASAYNLGNIKLKAEQGYEADLIYGNNSRDVNFEVDGFCNYINNFIFTDRLAGANGGDSVSFGYPTFKFLSNTAVIAGVAAYFNIHPAVTKWIEINNGFTYIYSYMPHQTDSTDHVPFTPAPRLTSEVKFKIPTGHSFLGQLYIEFGLAHYWAQNNIYSALYTELPSEAYTLYNAGIGTNFINPKNSRVICSLFINCTNLTNIAYIDHLSHNQYFIASNATIGVVTTPGQGIYNMGRNVSFKLVFPIGGYKVPERGNKGLDIN